MSFDFGAYAEPSNYMKFEEPGDSIEGQILSIVEGSDFNGNPVPVLEIETDEGELGVTAGPVVLRSELARVNPEVGDEIRIEFTGHGDRRPGRQPAKLFEVTIL